MLANETRSGLRDREDNGQLLTGGLAAGGGGTGCWGGEVGEKGDLIRVRGRLGRALTPQNYGLNRQEDARQPCILPTGVREHNP